MTTPEEELYVLVCAHRPTVDENGLYLFAQHIGSLNDLKNIQATVEHAYAKTRIARLQFVEEE